MNPSNNINKITKFISKAIRPKDFVNNHPADKYSETYWLKSKESDKDVVEDLGYMQRQLVKPKDISAFKNSVGFTEKTGFGVNSSSMTAQSVSDLPFKKRCFIYQKKYNHMQDTPLFHMGSAWVLEVNLEVENRHMSMLWGRFGSEMYTKWGSKGEMCFKTPEQAIHAAESMGWEYEVLYQGTRYHQLKSYAENFATKKEELSDTEEDDIRFDRI
mmetsp:Transcript_20585/g.21365  ORF Transcript_20585/g.21365 Transcript_20585/m.21365 type:complete len:215 (+) Transcript_20585:1-645(+)